MMNNNYITHIKDIRIMSVESNSDKQFEIRNYKIDFDALKSLGLKAIKKDKFNSELAESIIGESLDGFECYMIFTTYTKSELDIYVIYKPKEIIYMVYKKSSRYLINEETNNCFFNSMKDANDAIENDMQKYKEPFEKYSIDTYLAKFIIDGEVIEILHTDWINIGHYPILDFQIENDIVDKIINSKGNIEFKTSIMTFYNKLMESDFLWSLVNKKIGIDDSLDTKLLYDIAMCNLPWQQGPYGKMSSYAAIIRLQHLAECYINVKNILLNPNSSLL